MKRNSFFFALALVCATTVAFTQLGRAEQSLISASEAKPVPTFTLTSLKGETLSVSDLKGKVVVVDFWATWCGPCVAEIPGYVQLQEKYGDKLVIVGVSVDEGGVERVQKFAKDKKINYPIAMATDEVISGFGEINAIPTTFIVDQEGRVRFRKVGAMHTDEFEKLLQPLLAQK